jgi:hypothetical protein
MILRFCPDCMLKDVAPSVLFGDRKKPKAKEGPPLLPIQIVRRRTSK